MAGGLLVLSVWSSAIGALVVTRAVGSRLTRTADKIVTIAFRMLNEHIPEYRRRDRVMSFQAAAILVAQLAAWLATAFAGFTLLLWPFEHDLTGAFSAAGSSLFTLGFDVPPGATPAVMVFAGAATGLTILTLQIAYLPTLYAAFNRRETEVALLNSRAGVPSWGPELLGRTYYALGSGVSTIDTMPALYAQWERWASDVAESHTTYLPLVRFRSPSRCRPGSPRCWPCWTPPRCTSRSRRKPHPSCPRASACAAVSSASPGSPGPWACDPGEPDPDAGISLSYEEFLDAVERMRKVDFPIERDPADAWPDFVGWRANYEEAAYKIAYALDAVPALWSGPRMHPVEPIAPIRPAPGRPPKKV